MSVNLGMERGSEEAAIPKKVRDLVIQQVSKYSLPELDINGNDFAKLLNEHLQAEERRTPEEWLQILRIVFNSEVRFLDDVDAIGVSLNFGTSSDSGSSSNNSVGARRLSRKQSSQSMEQQTIHLDDIHRKIEQSKAKAAKRKTHVKHEDAMDLSDTSKKTFQCSECLKSFASKPSLKAHLATHKKKSTFRCKETGCEKSYSTLEGLRLHIRNHHLVDKKWICSVENCGRSFVRQTDLRLHVIRIHCPVRPFPCKEPGCTKSFACSSELKRHVATHTRKKKQKKQGGNSTQKRKDDEFPSNMSVCSMETDSNSSKVRTMKMKEDQDDDDDDDDGGETPSPSSMLVSPFPGTLERIAPPQRPRGHKRAKTEPNMGTLTMSNIVFDEMPNLSPNNNCFNGNASIGLSSSFISHKKSPSLSFCSSASTVSASPKSVDMAEKERETVFGLAALAQTVVNELNNNNEHQSSDNSKSTGSTSGTGNHHFGASLNVPGVPLYGLGTYSSLLTTHHQQQPPSLRQQQQQQQQQQQASSLQNNNSAPIDQSQSLLLSNLFHHANLNERNCK